MNTKEKAPFVGLWPLKIGFAAKETSSRLVPNNGLSGEFVSLGVHSWLRTSGFSLVEILCAVLILGVALTGLVQGVTTGLSSSKESELQTVAALFAAGQVETTRAEGDLRDGTTDGDCGEGLSLYRWQQTISPAGIDGLHEVTVVVQNSQSGKAIYELKTFVFEVPDDSQTRSPNSRRDSASQRRRSGSR